VDAGGTTEAQSARRNPDNRPHVQNGVDDDERQALRAEGLDPDVIAAIHLVRWELSLGP